MFFFFVDLVVLGETNDALHLLEKEGLNTINKLGGKKYSNYNKLN